MKNLLKLTVENISENPIRLYNSKTNHGSPIHELLKEDMEMVIHGIKRGLLGSVQTDIKIIHDADRKDNE